MVHSFVRAASVLLAALSVPVALLAAAVPASVAGDHLCETNGSYCIGSDNLNLYTPVVEKLKSDDGDATSSRRCHQARCVRQQPSERCRDPPVQWRHWCRLGPGHLNRSPSLGQPVRHKGVCRGPYSRRPAHLATRQTAVVDQRDDLKTRSLRWTIHLPAASADRG